MLWVPETNALDDRVMNNELKTIWKEVVVTLFKLLSRHFPGRAEEAHKELRLGYWVSGPKFKRVTTRIRSRIANHSALAFDLVLTATMSISILGFDVV